MINKSISKIEISELHKNFYIDGGDLKWKTNRMCGPRPGPSAGDIAGCLANGYRRVKIGGVVIFAHHIALSMEQGSWLKPGQVVDHIDGNRQNNSPSNLRVANCLINNQNHRSKSSHNKTSSFLGVSYKAERNKFRATITINNKSIHLGYFQSQEDAYSAYVIAKRKMHAGCTL